MATTNSVFKTSDEYSLPRNISLRITVLVNHFFLGSINCQFMFSFVYNNCLLPEAATGVEMFVGKGVLKNFVNLTGNRLCCSLFLKNLEAWKLFRRTSVNDCFCTALAPCNFIEKETLAQVFSCGFCEICKDNFSTEPAAERLQTTASAPSSSLSLLLLVISPMSVFCSNSKGSKKFESSISFSLSYFHRFFCHGFFCFIGFFLSFSVFFHFFLSLLINRILLSWELIKMFLPPLTSWKYVHVSK